MSDTPSLCPACLGDKAHLRFIRQPSGAECNLCTRPFTVFRWHETNGERQLRKTIFCPTCASARNCCQACMLDVDYGIPLDIRDAALKVAGASNPFAADSGSTNREVRAIIADKLESKKHAERTADEKRDMAKNILESLAAKLSGKTLRPKQKDVEMSNKEIAQTVAKMPFGGTLAEPEDASIRSFFVFGFTKDMPQYVLQAYFEKFGSVLAKIVHDARCGYVTFAKRSEAESCAQSIREKNVGKDKIAGLLLLDGEAVRVSWGTPRQLPSLREEQRKIALVVAKAMKQLAEKGRGKKKGDGRGERNERSETKSETKSYRALSRDVEL